MSLEEYLAETTTPLISEFLAAVIEKRPKNVALFMSQFGAEKASFSRSSSCDTEKMINPEEEVCERCVRLGELSKSLHYRFLCVSYDVMQLAKVPPWQMEDAVQKVRRRTVLNCKAVCQVIRQAQDQDTNVIKSRGVDTSSESTDDDVVQDELPDIFEALPARWRAGARQSVCAEPTSDIERHDLPRFKKSPEEERRIASILETCFIFSSLTDQRDVQRLLECMKPLSIPAGHVLLRQGDTGDGMYFIDKGELKIERELGPGLEPKLLRTLGPDNVVGELAVLYSCARSSTVTALTDCSLWYLDRQSFNSLVRGAAKSKRDQYETFLKSIGAFKSLGMYSRGKIADVLNEVTYEPGAVVIQEGDSRVDKFYIVLDGVAIASREASLQTREYSRGSFFGEVALLRNCARQATVKAATRLTVGTVERKAFRTVFADVMNVLEEIADQYTADSARVSE